MKKLTVLFSLMLMLSAFAFGSAANYRINDATVDAMFANATEVSIVDLAVTGDMTNAPLTVLEDKSKITAGLLALFLGGCGVHRWYLGSPSSVWLIYILLSCVGIGGIIALVDAVMIFTCPDAEFQSKWVGSSKVFNW